MANQRWAGYSTATSLLLAVGYGLLLRSMFHNTPDGNVMVTLSLAFLLLGPLAMGALAVWFAPQAVRTNWGTVIRDRLSAERICQIQDEGSKLSG